MHIAVVGSGYVGLVTGACLADFGMYVTCVDKDERKIAMQISSVTTGYVSFAGALDPTGSEIRAMLNAAYSVARGHARG